MKIHILYSWIGFKGGQPPSPLIITYVSNYKKKSLKIRGVEPPPLQNSGGFSCCLSNVLQCLFAILLYCGIFFY